MTETLKPLTDPRPEIAELAESDREDLLAKLEQQIRKHAGQYPAELVDELVALYRGVALRQTAAGWWLNQVAPQRDSRPFMQRVQDLFTADDKARLKALAGRR